MIQQGLLLNDNVSITSLCLYLPFSEGKSQLFYVLLGDVFDI